MSEPTKKRVSSAYFLYSFFLLSDAICSGLAYRIQLPISLDRGNPLLSFIIRLRKFHFCSLVDGFFAVKVVVVVFVLSPFSAPIVLRLFVTSTAQ